MRDDEGDELLLLLEGNDLDESPVDVFECFRLEGPATEDEDLESFVLLFEVLEELLKGKLFDFR